MAKKSKAISGLKIRRNGNKFIATWKLPKGGYKDLDLFLKIDGGKYRQQDKKGNNWGTKKSWTSGNLHPKKSVSVKIHGHKKGAKDSDDRSATYTIEKPKKPVVTAEWNSTLENQTAFGWTIADTAKTSKYWYLGYRYRYLTKWEGEELQTGEWSPRSAITASEGADDPGPESNLGNAQAFARIIEVRSDGQVGNSDVDRAHHVYSKPYAAKNLEVVNASYNLSGGIDVGVKWEEDYGELIDETFKDEKLWENKPKMLERKNGPNKWTWHPIDQVEVEWTVSNPAKGLVAPANLSGTTVTVHGPNAKNGANFTLDRSLEKNECLFFRVKTVHDKKETWTSWVRISEITTELSNPVFSGYEIGLDNTSVEITADNTAAEAVPDSFLAVSYRSTSGDTQSEPVVIGIIPNGENSIIAKCPESLDGPDEIGFSVQAFAYIQEPTNVVDNIAVYNTDGTIDTTKTRERFDLLRSDLYTRQGDGGWNVVPAKQIDVAFDPTRWGRAYSIKYPSYATGWYMTGSDALGLYYVQTESGYAPVFEPNETDFNENRYYLYKQNYIYTPVGALDVFDANTTYYSKFKISILTSSNDILYKTYTLNQSGLKSESVWKGGEVPKPPKNLDAVMNSDGVAVVTWDWSWSKATYVELAWSSYADALESTEPPSTYRVNRLHATRWNIHGLDAGVVWHIWARFIQVVGDLENEGPWSTMKDLNLTAAPTRPALNLSKGTVTLDEDFVASWVYTSNDGSEQDAADIFEVYIDPETGMEKYGSYRLASSLGLVFDPEATYYTREGDLYAVVAEPTTEDFESYYIFDDQSALFSLPSGSTAQSMTLNALRLGWEAGHNYNIVLRLKSKSNVMSEWSPMVSVKVAEELDPPVLPNLNDIFPIRERQDTSDEDEEVIVTQFRVLERLPLELNITGAGPEGTTIVSIERAEEYRLIRPDENDLQGYPGETVAIVREPGEGLITITKDDLIGHLDDGAEYNLIITIIDSNGQTATNAEDPIRFTVAWDIQPLNPPGNDDPAEWDVEVVPDTENLAVKITPVLIGEPNEDDTFDIYRLSVDAPQLIVEDGTFGETYVDPYPTIGEYGGHRVVYKTKYGDYIVDDDYAWFDLDENEGDIVNSIHNVINFGNDVVRVTYNVDLSTNWNKDFKETKYLGGHIQGDWNPAVSKTGSISTVSAREIDQETIEMFHRLGNYPGICHVRTKDGSSYAADVQVSENRSYSTNKIVSYSLNVTRVDSQGLDGMTLDEWNRRIGEG